MHQAELLEKANRALEEKVQQEHSNAEQLQEKVSRTEEEMRAGKADAEKVHAAASDGPYFIGVRLRVMRLGRYAVREQLWGLCFRGEYINLFCCPKLPAFDTATGSRLPLLQSAGLSMLLCFQSNHNSNFDSLSTLQFHLQMSLCTANVALTTAVCCLKYRHRL